MARIHEGRQPKPLKSRRPPEPQVVVAPQAQDPVSDDTIVETIFQEVLDNLSDGDTQVNPDWNPQPGNDR